MDQANKTFGSRSIPLTPSDWLSVEALAGLLFASGWVWSLALAFKQSARATVCCLFLFPFAQIYLSIKHPSMRFPTTILLLSLAVGFSQ